MAYSINRKRNPYFDDTPEGYSVQIYLLTTESGPGRNIRESSHYRTNDEYLRAVLVETVSEFVSTVKHLKVVDYTIDTQNDHLSGYTNIVVRILYKLPIE